MTKRADNVTETRQRIVEATVRLHSTIGLADASIAAIAAEAGVTRLTVYRHFPDLLPLFEACNAHWLSERQTPDPQAWAAIEDPAQRLRAGLADLYRFYRDSAEMLTWVHRDWLTIPEELRKQLEARDNTWRDVLVAPFAADGPALHRLRAVIAHAAAFPTWQSLCQQHGLSNDDAVEVMTALARAAGQSGEGGARQPTAPRIASS
jgi:AcrR family transcriptional regulator